MKRIVLCAFLLALSACSTLSGLKPGKGAGVVFNVVGKTYEQVWDASVKAVRQSGRLVIQEQDKTKGIIKAETTSNFAQREHGEIVAVFISQTDANNRIAVEVIGKQRFKLQLNGTDWESDIAAGIQVELGV
jgi:hypothetical protein